ncbi:MAG: hypothetical protein QG657_1257 [Acidobacteriota bacterium]|nr:hypothetical protein [Acidobacteriota bacterium]
MREFFRTNQHLVERKHDLWIVMKERFAKKDTGDVREVEDLFLQALHKMNRSYDSRDK